MAFTKLNSFSKKPADLPDVPSPSLTPDDIRSYWQTPLDELLGVQSDLTDELNGTGWVDNSKLAPKSVGVENLSDEILNQPTTTTEVQMKLADHDSKISDIDSQLNDIMTVNLRNLGAKEGTDCSALIQQANDNIVSSGKKGKIYIPFNVKITSTININISYVSLEGNSVQIDCSSMASGDAIKLVGTIEPPYNQALIALKGIELKGNRVSGTNGINFTSVSGSAGTSHILLERIVVHEFDIAETFGSNAYLVSHLNCDFYNNNTIINVPDSLSNYGENIRYFGCTLFNSSLVGNIQYQTCDVNFVACSFDYNHKLFNIKGAKVNIVSPHIEGNTFENEMITIVSSGNVGGNLRITGGYTIFNGSPHSYHLANVDTNSFLIIDGTYLTGLRTTFNELATGSGTVILKNIPSIRNTPINNILQSPNTNKMIDGSFEQSSIVDNISITSDTATISNRLTGTNIQLAIATDDKKTGLQSLKATKAYGSGSNSQFTIFIPISYGQWFNSSFSEKNSGTNGQVKLTYYLANVTFSKDGLHTINYKQSIMTNDFYPDANWTTKKQPNEFLCDKAFYNCALIEFNFYYVVGPGSIYLDDFKVGTY